MKKRKMIQRTLAGFMAVCMFVLSGSGFLVGSAGDEGFTEIIVSGDVDGQKAQQIVNKINGEITISPFGLACLFGHSTAHTTAYEINHRYYATAPRCLQTTYDVTYCTRSDCNYIVYTKTGSIRIYCCS